MRILFLTLYVVVALMIVGLCAGTAQADGFKVTALSAPKVQLDYMSSSYSNSRWLATVNGVIGEVSWDGSWNTYGIAGQHPYYIAGSEIAYYQSGVPMDWKGGVISRVANVTFAQPIRPTANLSGNTTYMEMHPELALETRGNQTVGDLPFSFMNMTGSWYLTSATYGPNGTRYVAGQNSNEFVNWGYHVCGLRTDGSYFDTGIAASDIAYGGGWLWTVSYDRSSSYAYKLGTDGRPTTCYGLMTGGYWNLLGADGSGAVFQQESLYWKVRAVPEPGSLLALGTGLVGLIGFKRRRR